MFSLNDVELDRDEPFEPPPPPRPSRAGWLIGAVIAVAIAAGVAYSVLQTRPATAPAVVTTPQRALDQTPKQTIQAPQAIAGDDIDLPPLPQTDPLVRQLVTKLSSHPAVAAWLATKGLIANFAVVTLNISEGKAPTTHLRALAPPGKFQTKGSGAALVLDPKSYDRYNGFAAAVNGLDATGTARLYATLKPRITDAYRELGYPDADFDRVLERAIGELLKTPIVEGTVALRPKTMAFAYADSRLESLSAAQKQFMRMGPRNVETVQAKLREIATLLALHPEGSVQEARR